MILLTGKNQIPFQIDAEDYYSVSRYGWWLNSDGYLQTNVGRSRTRRPLALHLFLLGPTADGLECDHIDRDKLNNQRSNLRIVSQCVNARNKGLRRQNTSGERGVTYDTTVRLVKRWRAFIFTSGKVKHLGCFTTKNEAVSARLAGEREYWGEMS